MAEQIGIAGIAWLAQDGGVSLSGHLVASRETGAATALNSVFDRAMTQVRRQVLDLKGRR